MTTPLRVRLARVLGVLERTADAVRTRKNPADRWVRMAIDKLGEDAMFVDLFDMALEAYAASTGREVSDTQFERMSESVDDALHAALNEVSARTAAVRVTFGPFLGARMAGDSASSAILVDGVDVGEIQRNMTTEWSGMSRSYRVEGYTVDIDDVSKTFDVDDKVTARQALTAAKDFARGGREDEVIRFRGVLAPASSLSMLHDHHRT